MKFFHLVLANLGRHKRRTFLTIASVALALFLFASLQTVVTTLERASQFGAHSLETAPDVALDRAERKARLRSDGGLREVGVEGEFDDLADSWFEALQRSGDQQSVGELVLARHPRLGLRLESRQLAAGQRRSR